MPPTKNSRMDEIAAKVAESAERYSVPWQNDRQSLRVINLSLDSVLLNPNSHRIRAQIESHPDRTVLDNDPFSESAQEIIETILKETVGFGALVDSLRESGQLESGIITHEGVLVNANTRAVALRQIGEKYIRVGVLPSAAVEREITELEARLQLARDYKQDYTLTNELLFVKEQIDAGTAVADLAILLGKAQSRNAQHLKRGVAEIEKSLRILQHIREVQQASGGAIPLTFFDPHDSALTEADNAYVKLQNQDPAEARRVRDGRITGVLVGVTYRNLRNWDTDRFLEKYVEPEFDGEEALAALASPQVTEEGSDVPVGLDILEAASEPTEPITIDPSQLLATVARNYGVSDESQVGAGMTKAQLYEEVEQRLTQAAEDREQDKRDERRQSTPLKLVKEARQRIVRARDALNRATRGERFKHGDLNYHIRQLRKEVKELEEANRTDV